MSQVLLQLLPQAFNYDVKGLQNSLWAPILP